MASDDLWYAGIRELGQRFRARSLSPVELTTALLQRIEKLEPTLHTFVTITTDRALADARAAEAAIGRGDPRPLLGMPIGYKDLYFTRGIRTTAGSALLEDWVPDTDATCVTRLSEGGCVMLGKLITHEFAWGIQTPGHRFEPARNPWNLGHIRGALRAARARRWPRACVSARSAPTPAGRSAGPPRSPASSDSSQPTVAAAAPAWSRCRGPSTTPARWPARSRIARTCCRRWPATIRSTPRRAARRCRTTWRRWAGRSAV